ncbi:hypothetical protein Ddye_031008 [Dipteronia dyeriana]|uniref:ZF-HD dimerization-type domain-containing protein n=1 Tax=Dipteronia dyeriana TaxID=168575 RepID=A0AAD9TI51_9ROSI|nr:hypothetical protein Ddye_031008 [Dipteronia dyeriana]
MDLTNNNINNTTINKTPDTQIDRQSPPPPPQTHPTNNKSLSFTNVSFFHPHHHPPPSPPPPPPEFMVVSYKECLKNHAASLGGHALDGCGEFMPSPTSNSKDPTSLKCAACGCHRNFHRRYPYDHHRNRQQQPITAHYSLPPPPAAGLHRSSSPSCTDPSTGPSLDPTSPQPVTSPAPCSFFSSAPHMLLALSSGYSGPPDDHHHHQHHYTHHTGGFTVTKTENPVGRKRSRTKFTQEQKDKMYCFAEKLGWRMLKSEEKSMQDFCSDVGVSRRVFKVWMHNHKNAFGKKDLDINNQIINDFVNGNNNNNHNEATLNLAISPKSED